MTMPMARGLKLGRCSKRKKSTDYDDSDSGLPLLPLKKKKKTMKSPGRFFRLGRFSFTAKKRKSKKKSKASEQQIKIGDVVDFSTLLFTKNRNYLLKGDNQRTKGTNYILSYYYTYDVSLFNNSMLRFLMLLYFGGY